MWGRQQCGSRGGAGAGAARRRMRRARAARLPKQRHTLPRPPRLPDFCYFVNAAAAGHLLLSPDDPRAEALVYALCDGPLAAALAAWQCAWVFGDSEHTVRCGGRRGARRRARPWL
jgi:hypothetical protein